MKNKKYCAWAKSSTNVKTMKVELPEDCRKKGCKGFFDKNIEPLCEDFMPIPEKRREEFVEHFTKLLLEH